MKSKKKILAIIMAIIVAALGFASCGNESSTASAEETAVAKTASGLIAVEYTQRDMTQTWDSSEATEVELTETYKITEAGVYVFTGTLKDGQIIVDVANTEKVQIVLNGVSITCADGPAILVESADKVFLTLGEGSENTVSDGSSYTSTEDQPWGCIFSRDDLTINGTGKLTVNGNYNNGIVSKDDLKITGGTIKITAKQNGVRGTDSVGICGGTLTISAGNDGIKSVKTTEDGKGYVSIDGGKITISDVTSQGIQGATIAQVTDGTINIDSDNEGIQGKIVYILGGETTIKATDDGLNATDGSTQDMMSSGQTDVYIEIAGGTVNIAANGDGIDSNGDLIVSGGTTTVMGPENSGNSPLDYQSNGKITGGTIIAVGSSGMSQNFGSDSTQASLLYNESTGSSKKEISLTDSDGKEIAKTTSTVEFSSILISTPDMAKGETYTLKVGDSSNDVEMTDIITTVGNAGMGGGGGGRGMDGGGRGDMGTPPDGTMQKPTN